MVLITIETPKPVSKVAGKVRATGGETMNRNNPTAKIVRPIHLDLERPYLWARCGLAYPAAIDAIPITVPCRPAIVSEVP